MKKPATDSVAGFFVRPARVNGPLHTSRRGNVTSTRTGQCYSVSNLSTRHRTNTVIAPNSAAATA